MKRTLAPARSSPRPKRPDGEATRQHLLQIAGKVFAERGYADATSKEICARAGVNLAAVNYHFGSREKLYGEVLIEAHRQIISLDSLHDIIEGKGEPTEKLRRLLLRLISIASDSSTRWGVQVILRELLNPSRSAWPFLEKAISPKAALIRSLFAQIMGVPDTHPAVQRGLMFSVLSCLPLVLFPAERRTQILPATALDSDGFVDDLMDYMQAGLIRLRERYFSDAKSQVPPCQES